MTATKLTLAQLKFAGKSLKLKGVSSMRKQELSNELEKHIDLEKFYEFVKMDWSRATSQIIQEFVKFLNKKYFAGSNRISETTSRSYSLVYVFKKYFAGSNRISETTS